MKELKLVIKKEKEIELEDIDLKKHLVRYEGTCQHCFLIHETKGGSNHYTWTSLEDGWHANGVHASQQKALNSVDLNKVKVYLK